MTRQEFANLCREKIVLLDGATGTNLQRAGMPAGECPERWILEHPEVLKSLQKEFLKAGTDILYAPTFSGNWIKLEEYGLGEKLAEINAALVKLSKEAVAEFEAEKADMATEAVEVATMAEGAVEEATMATGAVEVTAGVKPKKMSVGQETGGRSKRHYVAGDLTMTGKLLYPTGQMQFEELVNIYKEQVRVLVEAGADLFVIETMMSLAECRAAVLAVREECDLPCMVTLTFSSDGRTMYGTSPEAAVTVLQELGADAVGANCSSGPDTLADVISRMYCVAKVPVVAKPNAGMPKMVDGETVYDMTPEQFAYHMEQLLAAGAGLAGGCCGSEPAHIAALAAVAEGRKPLPPKENVPAMLATERDCFPVTLDGRLQVIGERINPTGKKALQAELREGKLDLALQYAKEQEEAGASILDLNAGMSGIDEKEILLRLMYEVSQNSFLPLSLDSSSVDVLEAVLRVYPGRALVNSVSCEKEKMERLLPIVKKYGAMFILLPLSENGLPKDQQEKREFIHTVMEEAEKNGIPKRDIVVDGLVNTVGANRQAAKETLATIRYCHEELGVATSIGLSNISFGLPARSHVNSAFLIMAVEAGLTMAIANPCQKMTMHAMLAADLLAGKEDADIAFIERSSEMAEQKGTPNAAGSVQQNPADKVGGGAGKTGNTQQGMPAEGTAGSIGVNAAGGLKENEKGTGNTTGAADGSGVETVGTAEWKKEIPMETSPLYQAVLKGSRRTIVELVKKELASERTAQEILNQDLIPAINEVGRLFEQKRYFLPQLIASAETMELAIAQLEPLLLQKKEKKQGKVVIATVKGDIHDIGKNLVALMLRNYGFEVIDLGKDVDAEMIVQTAREQQAEIIALSALMTTTMTRMKEVVELRNAQGIPAKIMIGGAVITEQYAEEIGADGYSKDAQEAVKLALWLCGQDS